MKLLRLKLGKEFRALPSNFHCQLRPAPQHAPTPGPTGTSEQKGQDGQGLLEPLVLAGLNGSGKSSLLEALAEIFFFLHAYCASTQDDDVFFTAIKESAVRLEDFEIEYLLPPDPLEQADHPDGPPPGPRHIVVRRGRDKSDTPRCFQRCGAEEKAVELRKNLPQAVVGYSSGENERLSLPFFKMRFRLFDDYIQGFNTGEFSLPDAHVLYLDREFTEAMAISLCLLAPSRQRRLLLEQLRLKDVHTFRIVLKRVYYEDEAGKTYNLLRNITDILHSLQCCATAAHSFEDEDNTEHYLDFWVNDATRKVFRQHFGSARELFFAFYFLLTLNQHAVTPAQKSKALHSASDFVKETIPSLPAAQRCMRFENVNFRFQKSRQDRCIRDLSDGETQLLHVLGMVMLYRDTNALFLLDEPETHLNPALRGLYISLLKQTLHTPEKADVGSAPQGDTWSEAGQGSGQWARHDMVLATHSPFLVSDSKQENVWIFQNERGRRRMSPPGYNTLGTSISKITLRTFGQKITIGQQPLNILQSAHQDIQSGRLVEAVRKLESLGDSVEKTLVQATIPDVEKH